MISPIGSGDDFLPSTVKCRYISSAILPYNDASENDLGGAAKMKKITSNIKGIDSSSPMVLFFPQHQAGFVPSNIPVGTPSLRGLWEKAPGFAEVGLKEIDPARPEMEHGIRFYRVLEAQTKEAAAIIGAHRPDFILTTGGDCGASFASIDYMNKYYNGALGVVWVDAHADIHTPSSSPSGNYHGMVLRHLMGSGEFPLKPALALRPAQIAYFGLRDTEREEDEAIEALSIPRFSARQVMDGNGPLEAVVAHFKKNGVTHLHLHVDCDVMDEAVFPHVHVPEPDGLSLERLLEILRYLRSEMPMAGCCLTEYAPATPEAGLEIVKRVYEEGLGLEFPE
ncbi:MAG: arginase family protein [Micavibrio sp.]